MSLMDVAPELPVPTPASMDHYSDRVPPPSTPPCLANRRGQRKSKTALFGEKERRCKRLAKAKAVRVDRMARVIAQDTIAPEHCWNSGTARSRVPWRSGPDIYPYIGVAL